MKKMGIVIFCLLFFCGCVKMRDYTYNKDGYFGLKVKKEIGQGGEVKDYYVTEDGIGLVVLDTKSEVTKKIGLPDNVEKTLEGYDCWIYESKGLKLFFNGDYLASWKEAEENS